MFPILFRNILCPQQMFPGLRSMETQHSFCVPRVCVPKKHHEQQPVRNNVSSFARALKNGSSIFVENDDVAIIMRVTRVHPSVSNAGDCCFQISPV